MGRSFRGRRGMLMDHQLSRRHLVQGAGAVGLGLLAGCGRLPGQATPARVYRVGILASAPNTPDSLNLQAFQQGLRELGYVVGQNITLEYSQETEPGQVARRAAELVRL